MRMPSCVLLHRKCNFEPRHPGGWGVLHLRLSVAWLANQENWRNISANQKWQAARPVNTLRNVASGAPSHPLQHISRTAKEVVQFYFWNKLSGRRLDSALSVAEAAQMNRRHFCRGIQFMGKWGNETNKLSSFALMYWRGKKKREGKNKRSRLL